MPSDPFVEFPEQQLTTELSRVTSLIKQGDSMDRILDELFEMLIHYAIETDFSPLLLQEQRLPIVQTEIGSMDQSRLKLVLELLQDIQVHINTRSMSVADRVEVCGISQQANSSYGGFMQMNLTSRHSLFIRHTS